MEEELEVLRAIYGEELKEPDHTGWFSICVCEPLVKEGCENEDVSDIWLYFTLQAQYPCEECPPLRLTASNISEDELDKCIKYIEDEIFEPNESYRVPFVCSEVSEREESSSSDHEEIEIISGDPITDRKSKFIAHIARITSTEQVTEVLQKLKKNHKIAKATHNILAYRIRLPDGSFDQHRDDDGETGAGDKLLDLLDVCSVENVVIIVTRWYGGVNLGPDRFKHINERALSLLKETNILQ